MLGDAIAVLGAEGASSAEFFVVLNDVAILATVVQSKRVEQLSKILPFRHPSDHAICSVDSLLNKSLEQTFRNP